MFPATLPLGGLPTFLTNIFSRLDEVEDAVNINTKLSQTVKSKEEKIESLESRLALYLMLTNWKFVGDKGFER